MIAEPYICIKPGIKTTGKIEWWFPPVHKDAPYTGHNGSVMKEDAWQPYADFEREKLRELKASRAGVWIASMDTGDGWGVCIPNNKAGEFIRYYSDDFIGYASYDTDSESCRLLKRAEFLKAVCEKEGVEWLPDERLTDWKPTAKQKKLSEQDEKTIDEMLEYHLASCTRPGCCKPQKEKCEACEDKRVRKCGFCGRCLMCCREANGGKLCKPTRDTYTKDEIDTMFKNLSSFLNTRNGCVDVCEKRWRRALVDFVNVRLACPHKKKHCEPCEYCDSAGKNIERFL